MKIHKILLLSFLTIALFSCKNDDEEISAGLPTILTITPESATIGSSVVINGANFSTNLSQNKVRFFQGTATANGIITQAGKNIINTTIPTNLTPGEYLVEVTVDGKSTVATNRIVVMEAGTSGVASVSSVAPVSGEIGSELVISGFNFSIAPQGNQVSFVKEDNTITKATIVSSNSTTLKVKVPEVTSGSYTIRVQVDGQVLIISTKYTIKSSVIIDRFYPAQGEKGTILSIYGSDFSLTKKENAVYFISGNSVLEAPVLASTASFLNVEVPVNIIPGDFIIKVIVNGKVSISKTSFKCTATVLPTITGFSASTVYSGATLTIKGADFSTNVNHFQVFFVKGSTEEKSIVLEAENDHLTVIVPSLPTGSYDVKIYKYEELVIAPGKITSIVAPFVITEFLAGESSIELIGSGFSTASEENIVEFIQSGTSIPATVISSSESLLEVEVPESLQGEYYIKITIDDKSVTLPDTYLFN